MAPGYSVRRAGVPASCRRCAYERPWSAIGSKVGTTTSAGASAPRSSAYSGDSGRGSVPSGTASRKNSSICALVRVGLSAYRVGVPHDVVEHVPAVVDRCGQGSPRGEQAVLHGDDHRGQARGEVAVHPVALHRGAHEPAAVHVENQRKVVSPGGRGSVHPDAHHTVRQRDLLPPDHRVAIRKPGDHPRDAGHPFAVLRLAERTEILGRHRRPGRLAPEGSQQPDAQGRLCGVVAKLHRSSHGLFDDAVRPDVRLTIRRAVPSDNRDLRPGGAFA